MHIREIKKINGIDTIVSKHQTDTDLLIWDGQKWVLDIQYTYTVNQMLRSVIKEKE